jgi:diacylglycerol kinase (ATP)
MRIHFLLAVAVLLASLFFQLSRLELLVVFAAISLVLIAEMLNTAVEWAIDLFTTDLDPRAKVAKDVAAGAVLVAAVNSLLVAYFIFANRAASLSTNLLTTVRRSPTHLTFITLLLVVLVTIVIKAGTGRRSRLLSGGLPSGHAAVAFSGWTAVTFITAGHPYHILLSALTFFMAMLTAQSRVETGIHTRLEVALGAILGAVVTTLIFQLLT